VVRADGSRVPYDLVLIAAGVRSRAWPDADQALPVSYDRVID
jgi:hypothetical protein